VVGVRPRRIAFGVLGLALSCVAPAAVRAEPVAFEPALETPRERARELMRAGNARYRADDVQGAHDFYERAFRVAKSFDVACNLGRTEMDLNRYRDAAEHLDYCVRFHILSSKPEAMLNEQEAREQLQAAKQHVGWVWISVDRDGAELWVDSLGVGRAPRSVPIFLEPGPHVAVATSPGLADASVHFRAEPGVEQVVTLRPLPLKPESPRPEATAPALASRPAPVEDTTTKPRVLPWVTGGLAVVGVGVGAGFLVAASQTNADKQEILNSLPESSPCGENTPYASACSRVRSLSSDARTKTAIGLTSLGVGVIAGVATAVLLMQPTHEVDANPPATARTRVLPTVSSNRWGVTFDTLF